MMPSDPRTRPTLRSSNTRTSKTQIDTMRRTRQRVPTCGLISHDRVAAPTGSTRSRERSRNHPEQAPVGVGELGAVNLAAQHSELVAQHDDLKVL